MLEGKNVFPDYKNNMVKKVEKLVFFQRCESMVLILKWKFSHLYI